MNDLHVQIIVIFDSRWNFQAHSVNHSRVGDARRGGRSCVDGTNGLIEDRLANNFLHSLDLLEH